MTKIRLLFLMLFLCLPASAFAQTKTNADKSWQPFWTEFTAAVNKKYKALVKMLMSAEKDFFSGGGGETRDEWLQMIDEQRWWGRLQKSVRLGTKQYNYNGKPSRITKDNHLIFVYIGRQWRFVGIMGD